MVPVEIKELLEADIGDIPMKDKHKLLGKAAFYLDAVVHSGTIPGTPSAVIHIWYYNSWIGW